jgi:hypothetical protein
MRTVIVMYTFLLLGSISLSQDLSDTTESHELRIERVTEGFQLIYQPNILLNFRSVHFSKECISVSYLKNGIRYFPLDVDELATVPYDRSTTVNSKVGERLKVGKDVGKTLINFPKLVVSETKETLMWCDFKPDFIMIELFFKDTVWDGSQVLVDPSLWKGHLAISTSAVRLLSITTGSVAVFRLSSSVTLGKE